MPSNDIHTAVRSFFEGCQRISTEYMERNYPSLTKPVFELQELQIRYRILRDRSAFAFVDKATGDVLKAASWSKPAKHARGNVFDTHNGLAKIGPYGPAYLR
ncbi:hypothetical protein J4G48_0040610 [Bradyrhizobium barranii subsp. apii]|uniref:DUF7717 family protein n=1 Tax=Bradyrhizobium barranii TaxID=2992140 RepID=UPI001AA0CCA6|nr:hypothetical protein [Bradyrhizobium barranii]UPT95459.1 hypothetical protein J4G48_0040610 [Bradyrhizobium barranii subsp. apii]